MKRDICCSCCHRLVDTGRFNLGLAGRPMSAAESPAVTGSPHRHRRALGIPAVGDWWFFDQGKSPARVRKQLLNRAICSEAAGCGQKPVPICACGPLRKPAQLRPVEVLGGPPAAEHGATKIWDRSKCLPKSPAGHLKEWKKWEVFLEGASQPRRRS